MAGKDEKDYKVWIVVKRGVNAITTRLFFHEREIWYCNLGENIGYEQDGRGESFLRPVVIVRKFNNEIFWGIPLTRAHKDLPFYYRFRIHTEDVVEQEDEDSSAILTQIRLIDAKRLRRHIGSISTEDFALLKKKLKALLP